MVEETRRLLDHLVWDDRNFMELLTADYAYLSSDLATLYKLPAPAGQFELVHFPAGTPPRRTVGRGVVPGGERGADRDIAHRARNLHPGTIAVPARAASAAERGHQPARGYRGQAAHAAAADVGARGESALRFLPSVDGSHRLRP